MEYLHVYKFNRLAIMYNYTYNYRVPHMYM